jgi:EmrB/QacA subfamily drug resistance transporter
VPLRINTAQGKWVIAATVLGSSMVFLDGTVVNVALPRIGSDFNSGISELQWILNGYLLSLSALILLGGSLGDRFGRRRIFVIGAVWFTVASALCGLATSGELLVAGRILQGVGGAMLAPGSLAIIEAGFAREDRGRAIGIWSGLAGASTAIGPPLGGWLIDAVSWRAVFFLNVPFGIAVVLVTLRHVPETRDETLVGRIDYGGAGLAMVALGAISWALIEGPGRGFDSAVVAMAIIVGCISVVLFLWRERRADEPMLPLDLFRSRTFSGANLLTFVVYGAFGGALFLLTVLLQTGLGYTPLAAGAASLPITFLLLFFSARSGAIAQRTGPRLPLTLGSLVLAASLLLMHTIDTSSSYVTGVLPSIMLLGIGLVFVVAPITATTLAAAPDERAGVASAVSNAVSRTGQLFAIALLPAIGGLTGSEYDDPSAIVSAFQVAVLFSAALCVVGAVIAWFTIDNGCLSGAKTVTVPASDPVPHVGIVDD